MFKIKFSLFLLLLLIFFNVQSQTLMINEVSNGTTGAQEYVEFVVVSSSATYDCSGANPPCIDIRGWIYDDNNGYHSGGAGTGTGVAGGAVRFSNNVFWSCIPLGTIILIYNNVEKNTAITLADDLSMSDGNCRIIAPINNTTLFDRNSTTPGDGACSYPATGWTAGGLWSNTGLLNSSDCARLVNLSGCEVFSVCYGSVNNQNNLIYFSGTGGGNAYYFNSGDPNLQVNWSFGNAATFETPGLPNNAANAAYINQFNNGCAPITPINVTATTVNAGCTCTGSATATASGSIASYTYEWFDASFVAIGQTTPTATSLCAGNYHVIATSSIGCKDTAHFTIASSGATSVTVNSATICNGGSTTLTATPSAGGGTYSWAPGGATTNTVSVSPTSNQTYTVTYILAGCAATGTGVVTVNPRPTVTSTSATVCNGQSATITAGGANTYVWNTGATTAGLTINPATATSTYTVTGTNTTTTCTNTATGTITVNPLPVVASTSVTVCSGQSATITASGANTYVWNTGATTAGLTINPATAASTTYTVTGTNTTTTCTNTATGTITVNPLPVVASTSTTVCSGQSATITASGANTYVWNTGATTAGLTINPATAATTYTVTGTNTATTCTNTATGTITVNPLPVVASTSVTVCNGQSATITASGANTYLWNTGAATAGLTINPATATTTYTVTGTNTATTCTNTATGIITVNPLPTLTVNSETICPAGSATLTATGATTYVWDNGSTSSSLTDNPAATTSYTVSGTSLGCTSSATATITVVAALPIAITSSTICTGQSATLTATGATTYLWNDGSTTNSITVSPGATTIYSVTGTSGACFGTGTATVTVNALPIVAATSTTVCSVLSATITASGADAYVWNTGDATAGLTINPAITTTTYTVTGIDIATTCTNTATGTITVNPLPIVASTSTTVCSGQSATISASGADTYLWNTGDATAGLTINPATTSNTYTVTGTNTATSCTNTATGTITVNPLPLVAVTSTTVCSGQSASIMASGADNYIWNTGDVTAGLTINPATTTTNYTVTGINIATTCTNTATGTITVKTLPTVTSTTTTVCNSQSATITASGADTYLWNTGATGMALTINPATITSNYTVVGTNTVTSCSNIATGTINVNALPVVSATSIAVCSGQSASIAASGADTYSWNTGDATASLIINPATSTSTYTVTGTNAATTCTNTVTGTITVNPLPSVSSTSLSVCDGQSATITASGADAYVWNTGDATAGLTINPATTTNTYTVTGINLATTCTNTATGNITVNPLPTVTSTSTTVCNSQSATITASGADTYVWNTGATGMGLTINPATATNTYTVVGTNILTTCFNTATGIITVNALPVVAATSTAVCSGQSASIAASGADTYSWNTGANTLGLTINPATSSSTFTVIGTNTLTTCSNTATGTITVNSIPTIGLINKTICDGNSATLTASGANSYLWSTNAVTSSISVNPTLTTTYTVTGTSAGCSATNTVQVIVNDAPAINFTPDVVSGCQPTCITFNTSISSLGALSVSNWSWSMGDGSLAAFADSAINCYNTSGIFDIGLTVTYSNGCSTTLIKNDLIEIFPRAVADFTTNANDVDALDPTVMFTNLSSNATSFNWNFGDLTSSTTMHPNHIYQQEGTYLTTLIANNQYGCRDTISKLVEIKPIFTFYAPNAFSPNDDSSNEKFLPLGTGWDIKTFKMYIFDRWGNLCYSTTDHDAGWDGKANGGSNTAQIDSYVWKVTLSDVFGTKHNYHGIVNIVK